MQTFMHLFLAWFIDSASLLVSGTPDELHPLTNISIIHTKRRGRFTSLCVSESSSIRIPFLLPQALILSVCEPFLWGSSAKASSAEIVAPVDREGILEGIVPVRRLEALEETGRYDLVKTCYHDSILLIERYRGPWFRAS